MTDIRFDLPVQIRSTARAKLALDRLVAAVRASNKVRWKRGRATQEAVFSAVWLWLEDLGEDVVIEAMAQHIPRLEALMRGQDSASPGSEFAGDPGPPKPRRGGRKTAG